MNNTVNALQALYVKLGGSLTDTYSDIANGAAVGDYVTIPDVIEACAKIASSSGDSLPTVSAADNGDVLTVVSGAWAKANAPTYTPFVVTFTASGGTYSADKTLAEINTAWANSKDIIGYNSETGYVLPCVLVNSSVALFSAVALIAADTFAGMAIQVTTDGVTYEQETLENAQA